MVMIAVTNTQMITMKTRQPAGTNHNQFRDHQFRRIGGGVPEGIGGGIGGGVLAGSTNGRFTLFRVDVEGERNLAIETVLSQTKILCILVLVRRFGCPWEF